MTLRALRRRCCERSFVLAPEVDVSVVGRKEAVLTCRGVSVVFCAESDISVREGLYSPHYGAVHKELDS